ncbi:hypothetical protein Cni_G13530 [Canna indica]|uniref:Uncharacterized protein n=1 Tax=Canna indica TaxID=4628 RepID=A0AAQ3KCS6_9LILI|nr:hypothetical protein Cni_G13530 [Canna indica]
MEYDAYQFKKELSKFPPKRGAVKAQMWKVMKSVASSSFKKGGDSSWRQDSIDLVIIKGQGRNVIPMDKTAAVLALIGEGGIFLCSEHVALQMEN